MNAIRNYLDNMFRNLPNTEAVRKAKRDLLEMMEDKYEELIAEGKSENEAVGIVISEFGNLDELAESLGISEAVTENPDENKPMLSMDRIKEYIEMNSQRSILMPLGVALCIFSVAFNILADMVPGLDFHFLGVSGMFLAIAGAVVLFIFSGMKKKEFAEVAKKECSLSIEGAEYVRAERKSFKTSYGLMSSIGIGLCILSVVNPIIIGSIPYINDSFGAVMFFLFIALGVFLIVSSNTKMNGYDRILALNEAGRMSEEFVPKSDRKVNKAPIIACAVVALVVAVIIGGLSVAKALFRNVSDLIDLGDDYIETMATTYELEGGSEMTGAIKSIKMDLTACTVNFEVAEGSGLLDVEYSGDKRLKPEVSFENGKLVVTQKGVKNIKFMGINSPKLTIKVGTDVDLESIEMKVNAGDVKLNNLKADYFYGDFDAGNINIDNSTIRKAEIEANAGNIEIEDSDVKIVKLETNAGNIQINSTTFEEVEIDVDFGNVEIHDVENLDGYSFDCDVDAGIVQVDHASIGRSYRTGGSGAGSINVEVDAGNIEID